MVLTIGVTISAYLAIGVTKVVNMATFELMLLVGRFKVISDSTFDPNMR